MKILRIARSIALAAIFAATFAAPSAASAQYYQIASQLPGLISPALSGSLNYRGFVEASGLAGMGRNRANFLGVSTSQGFMYADWFYMGVGVGVDAVMTHADNNEFGPNAPVDEPSWGRSYTKTKAMIPVFSDFRFYINAAPTAKVYIGVKAGAAWLLGSSWLRLQEGRMSGNAQFYLRPSIGARFAINKDKPAQALTVALTYQLLTSNNNWNWNGGDVTLNSLGLTISYEFGK